MSPTRQLPPSRSTRGTSRTLLLALVLTAIGLPVAASGREPGGGHHGGRCDAGHGDEAWAADRDLFHALLDHRESITRTVSTLANGVSTLTETDDPDLRTTLREHVASMHVRIREGRGIHLRDPLFAEVFRHADRIEMRVEDTGRGIRVTETSEDPYVAQLIRAHAAVLDEFLANGRAEVRRDHAVPERFD